MAAHRRPALAAIAATLLCAPVATAADAPPSAVTQYVESIPTAEGTQTPDARSAPPRTTPLAPAVETQISEDAGTDAPVLRKVATESSLGAPQRPRAIHAPRLDRTTVGGDVRTDDPGVLRAVVEATGALDGGRFAVLALLLSLVTAVAFGARLSARRRVSG